MENKQFFDSNSQRIMSEIEKNDEFCEIGKKAVKLHLMGCSVADIAKMLGQDEQKIRETIDKMNRVVK